MTDNQFGATTDFVFNCGVGEFNRSTARKLIVAGKLDAVPAEFQRYIFSKGQKMNGLVTRRAKETLLYNSPDPVALATAAEASVTPDSVSTPRVWTSKPVIGACVATVFNGVQLCARYWSYYDRGCGPASAACRLRSRPEDRIPDMQPGRDHPWRCQQLPSSQERRPSMITAFLALAPWKRFVDIAVAIALIGGALWVYFALVHRAEAITALMAANVQLTTAAQDNANAAQKAQLDLARTTAALQVANKHAEANAALAGTLKERISHAPKYGCMGPAERALLDGLRTDALNRRSQVPQPVAP